MATTYPFDPTGVAQTNLIQNEQQVLKPPASNGSWSDYYFILPLATPYFSNSLHITLLPSGKVLQEGVDYICTHRFYDASLQCASSVYGSITFMDKTLAGIVNLTYQTLGGDWTLNSAQITEILANVALDPRTTTWEMVANIPYQFPPINHQWNVVDMVGQSDVVAAINAIATAINSKGAEGLAAHLIDYNNPHHVTAAQVGLGNVSNFAMASNALAVVGTDASSYMSPVLTAAAITAQVGTAFSAHVANVSNPHHVTATQVGLGNVNNAGWATTPQAQAGTDNTTYMNPALTGAAIATLALGPLNTHIANQNNPHAVTATQVGLSNVANYPMATLAEATSGVATDRYMSPSLVAAVMSGNLGGSLAAHIADHNNPHQVTADQVGLDQVGNYGWASTQDAIDGVSTTGYMNPALVAAVVSQSAGSAAIAQHIQNYANPHQVTALQVGLGNVVNVGWASVTDAQAGLATTGNMNPSLTASAIATQALAPLNTHIDNTTNPHVVTATQVGLGAVVNQGMASTADAQGGTSSTGYMNPVLTAAAITAQVGGTLSSHLADTTNPHEVTADQVGLGSVVNQGMATTADAQGGTSSAGYMNPVLTAAAITTQVLTPLNTHLADTTNPHQVTASQVGAYTSAQTDAAIAAVANAKLDTTAKAADTSLFQGKTLADVLALAQNSYTGRINYYLPSFTSTDPPAGAHLWSRLGEYQPISTPNPNELAFFFLGGDPQGSTAVKPLFKVCYGLMSGKEYVRVTQYSGAPGAVRFVLGFDSTTGTYQFWISANPVRNGASMVLLSDPGTNWGVDSADSTTIPGSLTSVQPQYVYADEYRPAPRYRSSETLFGSGYYNTPIASKYSNGLASDQVFASPVMFLNVATDGPSETSAKALALDMKNQYRAMGRLAAYGSEAINAISRDVWLWDNTNSVLLGNDPAGSSALQTLTSVEPYPASTPFQIEVEVGSTDPMDESIGVCVAQFRYEGKVMGVWALRTPGGTVMESQALTLPGGDLHGLFTVGLNLFQDDAQLLAKTNTGLTWGDGVADANRASTPYVPQATTAGTNGWASKGNVRIRATYDGASTVTFETTDFGSTTYVAAATITVNLSGATEGTAAWYLGQAIVNGGWSVMGARWGLAFFNQPQSTFKVLTCPDLHPRYYMYQPGTDGTDNSYIGYYTGNATAGPNSNGWYSLNYRNNLLVPGRMVYSDLSGMLYLVRRDSTLQPLPIIGSTLDGRQIITT